MINKTQMVTAAVAVALSIMVSPTFAQTTSYDFDPVSGQSFGATTSNTSITVGNATFSQANASTATYAFNFGPNNGIFSNIGGGAGTILTTNGYASGSGAPASLTISFASTVYSISFNYGNDDFIYGANGNDQLTATINGMTVETATPTFSATNGDFYAEGPFLYTNANGFTSITLTSTDAAGAEDLALGDLSTEVAPVPAPAGILLLGGGLAVLGFKWRRRTV